MTRLHLLRSLTAALAVSVLTLVAAPHASAQIVYNNGALNGGGGNEFTQWIQAESFFLAAPTTITGFRFWSNSNEGTYNSELTWQIYSDNAGVPGTVLLSDTVPFTRVADGTTLAGRTQFRTDIEITFTDLLAGTYWLGLHNGPLTNTERAEIYWSTTDANATLTGLEDEVPFGVGGWGASGLEHAFVITGLSAAAPEPSAMALALLPICAWAVARRRRS